MSFAAGLVVYFTLWWVIIFMVLPWGVNRNQAPQAGTDPGAPRKSHIIKKLMITTVITTVVWLIVYKVISIL